MLTYAEKVTVSFCIRSNILFALDTHPVLMDALLEEILDRAAGAA